MKVIMNYPIVEQEKHVLWAAFDDEEHELNRYKIHEFRVCDCFVDWIIYFQNENKNSVFPEDLIIDFFDQIPCKLADCDVFSIFGKVTIVCCRNALYHFFYKEDVQHDKLDNECFGWVMTLCCIYRLLKKLSFSYLCSNCQFNFVKNVTTRFIRIKND